MNICIALFRISLEIITYIFIQLQRYLEYAEIFTSFSIHIYLIRLLCRLSSWVSGDTLLQSKYFMYKELLCPQCGLQPRDEFKRKIYSTFTINRVN